MTRLKLVSAGLCAVMGVWALAYGSTRAADPTPLAGTVTPTATAATVTPRAGTSTPASPTTVPNAQAPFIVRISADRLDQPEPLFRPDQGTPAKRFQRISAWVGDKRCATVDLIKGRSSNGDAVMQLGTGKQPADCGREGATVRFTVRETDDPLFQTLVAHRGTTAELTNLLPAPVETGLGLGVKQDGGGGSDFLGVSRILVVAAVIGLAVGAGLLGQFALHRGSAGNRG